ncbi:MAG: sodium:solute symporter family transporter [Planctomycetota bacterium]|jgi:SSS family transporter
MDLGGLDTGILLVYLLGTLVFGIWVGRRPQSSSEYMLGGRNMPWWLLLFSIVATETSTVTFLSMPGISFANDLTWLQLPMGFCIGRLLIIGILLPRYFEGRMFTAYEVLQKRLGARIRRLASLLFLVTRSLADGLRLYLSAIVLQELAGIDLSLAVVCLGAATIIYTFLGGLRAVVWTDFLQFLIYMSGAGLAFVVLLGEIPGGWGAVETTLSQGDKLRFFDFGWELDRIGTFWAGLIGGAVLSMGTHGVDQMMVQRYLAAKSQAQAGLALGLSGFLAWAQASFFMLIGLTLFVWSGSAEVAADRVFAQFIIQEMPVGARGIVLGAIFAAAMSTLSSSLNSSATTMTHDLYIPLRRGGASDREELKIVRAFTIFFGCIQIGVGCLGQFLASSVIDSVLAIAGFTTGLILGLFFLGLRRTRISEEAALLGFIVGLLVTGLAAFGTSLAWPWYAVLASGSTLIGGILASRLRPVA